MNNTIKESIKVELETTAQEVQEKPASGNAVEQEIETHIKSGKKSAANLKKIKEALEQSEKENLSLKSEVVQLKDQYLRLLAEFDNFRKRRASEAMQASELTKKEIILRLLPVLDDINRLFQHQNHNGENLSNGVKMIAEKVLKIFSDIGVKPMELEGKPFDPEKHEALLMVEKPEIESGVIVEVHEPGYTLNDAIIRHAKVIVNK